MGETTRLAPNSIIATENLQDTNLDTPPVLLSDIQDEVDDPDANWWTAVDPTLQTKDHLGFPPPAGALVGAQTFRTWRRKTAGTPNPTLTMNLREDGTLVRALLSDVPITSTTGQTFEGNWSASEITDPTLVECEVIVTPGEESSARTFDVSPAVEGKTTWDLDVDGPMTVNGPGTWTITPSSSFEGDVELWGGGGGSAGHHTAVGANGEAGTASTFLGLSAGGGDRSLATASGSGTDGGVGGTASGGDINTNGSAGTAGTVGSPCVAGDGGASPNGGATQPGGSIGSNNTSINGVAGNGPGGGASGSARFTNGASNRNSTGGGGGGAYVKKTYDSSIGTSPITLTVGDGGAGGIGTHGNGAAGAAGRAVIT